MYSSVGIDQGMDGEAVSLAFASTAGPDCLKDVVMKYGLRLKVYRAIKEQLECVQVKSVLKCHCNDSMPLLQKGTEQKAIDESQDDSTIILVSVDTVEGMLLALAILNPIYLSCCAFYVSSSTIQYMGI